MSADTISNQKHLEEIEKQQSYYEAQIALRDKLIIRLLEKCDVQCHECILESVCCGGDKYNACAKGMLAVIKKEESTK